MSAVSLVIRASEPPPPGPDRVKITMNTKLYDEHEDQSPQNSKVSLVAEALPGLIYRRPLGENSSFHSKTKVQTTLKLMSACFENALILKITLGKIIVSHQNGNLSLTFLFLTKILI